MPNPAPFELSLWQKRQATLLYHFASLDYLKALLPQIDELIAFADAMVGERQKYDAEGLARSNWTQRDTAAHFGTYGYPALQEFRESTLWHMGQRAFENYGITGANQCSRMLQEYSYPMTWATYEQEEEFKGRAEKVFRYAGKINSVMARPTTLTDFSFWVKWADAQALHSHLPKFRVRPDVEGESEKIPPRTGVYVPQDDPHAALQFRWTGGGYGELGSTYTFNALGLEALQAVGRNGLWGDTQGILRFIQHPQYRDVITDLAGRPINSHEIAASALARKAFIARPCKWYFVEMINGEYEVGEDTAKNAELIDKQPRIAAGLLCPKSGWWHTPAKAYSRRRFSEGDRFPAIEASDYGATFWLWSQDQSG